MNTKFYVPANCDAYTLSYSIVISFNNLLQKLEERYNKLESENQKLTTEIEQLRQTLKVLSNDFFTEFTVTTVLY